jgi:hypothetical protein
MILRIFGAELAYIVGFVWFRGVDLIVFGNVDHMRIWHSLCRNRTGASAFEFALVLPLFVMMTCGTLQYGVLFYTWNVALTGARNAARAVAVSRADVAGGETMMREAVPGWVGAGGNGGGGGSGGINARVTDATVGGEVVAQLSFPSDSATFLSLMPMPETVSVTVRMVKEA